MKNSILIPMLAISSLFTSAAVFAAKLVDATCYDYITVNDLVTPQYLAAVDGFKKSNRQAVEEVDLGSLVAESKILNEQCLKNMPVLVSTLKKHAKDQVTAFATSDGKINLLKAKCEDFIALNDSLQPAAVFWVAGHSKVGKLKLGQVDEEFLERPIATLIQYCKERPEAPFYDKTKIWFEKSL